MVEKAESFDGRRRPGRGRRRHASRPPRARSRSNGDNHHIAKTALIGKIGAGRPDHTEWTSGAPIEPDPYLKGYPWATGLSS